MSDIDDASRGTGGSARATDHSAFGPGASAPSRPAATQSATFTSGRGAAQDAIKRFNPASVAQNREYGGTLYRVPGSAKVRYVLPPNVQARGTSGGHVSTAQTIPVGAVEAGRWHTHGKTENYTDEDFSEADLRLARARGLPSWLGTPKGAVKVAVPTQAGMVILDVEPSEGTRPNIRSVPFPP